jgi:hypothetical protein
MVERTRGGPARAAHVQPRDVAVTFTTRNNPVRDPAAGFPLLPRRPFILGHDVSGVATAAWQPICERIASMAGTRFNGSLISEYRF